MAAESDNGLYQRFRFRQQGQTAGREETQELVIWPLNATEGHALLRSRQSRLRTSFRTSSSIPNQINLKTALALRPLEYNTAGTELDLEWYWLPKQKHGFYDFVPLTGYLPLSSQSLYSSNDHRDRPMDVIITLGPEVFHAVRTGDKFVLRTSDHEKRPLPSKEVLDFQVLLQRLVSLAGVGREGLVSR